MVRIRLDERNAWEIQGAYYKHYLNEFQTHHNSCSINRQQSGDEKAPPMRIPRNASSCRRYINIIFHHAHNARKKTEQKKSARKTRTGNNEHTVAAQTMYANKTVHLSKTGARNYGTNPRAKSKKNGKESNRQQLNFPLLDFNLIITHKSKPHPENASCPLVHRLPQ